MKNFFANAISNELIFVYGLIALVIILIIVIVIIDKKESRKKPKNLFDTLNMKIISDVNNLTPEDKNEKVKEEKIVPELDIIEMKQKKNKDNFQDLEPIPEVRVEKENFTIPKQVESKKVKEEETELLEDITSNDFSQNEEEDIYIESDLEKTQSQIRVEEITEALKKAQVEEQIDIYVEDGQIKNIGKNLKELDENIKIIDAKKKVVMPGLINTHAHIPMSIFRETLDGYNLQEWLNDKIWPMEDKLQEQDIYYASYLSFIEMIKTGCTTINDMYFMTDEIIKAMEETGIRLQTTRTLQDIDGLEAGEKRLQELQRLIDKYKNKNSRYCGPCGFGRNFPPISGGGLQVQHSHEKRFGTRFTGGQCVPTVFICRYVGAERPLCGVEVCRFVLTGIKKRLQTQGFIL